MKKHPSGDQIGARREPWATGHLMPDLGRRVVSASLLSGIAILLRVVGQIASVIILARVLSPSDFGLVAMALPVYRAAEVVADLGLSAATVQRDQITQRQLNSVFWAGALMGVVLAVLLCLLAPLLAGFYGEPRLEGIIPVFGALVLIGSLSVQHSALLQRQLRVGLLSFIELLAMAAGIGCAVAAALIGLGYWSLIILSAATGCVTAVSLWATSGWRPGPPSWDRTARGMLTFGSAVTGAQLLLWVTRTSDFVVVGRIWGDVPLGYYSRAQALLLQPTIQVTWPLSRAIIPALSRLQDSPEKYRLFFVRAAGLFVAFLLPVVTFVGMHAELLVGLVLGPAWLPVAPFLAALAPAAFATGCGVLPFWIFASLGQSRQQLLVAVVQAPVVVVAVISGTPLGPIGAAIGLSAALATVQVSALAYSIRSSPVRGPDLLRAFLPPVAAAALASFLTLAARHGAAPMASSWSELALRAAIFGTVYFIAYAISQTGRKNLAELRGLLSGN